MSKPFIKLSFILLACFSLCFTSCGDEKEVWEEEVDMLREAAKSFTNFEDATALGYDTDVTGYVPMMGHHWNKASITDGTFNILEPEILLFVPNDDGTWEFVCAEYAIPITEPIPEGFTGANDVWVANPPGTLWTLHCWIGKENPDGIFAEFNPTIP